MGSERSTLGPTYNEFGCNELNRFLCIQIIKSNVKVFGYSQRIFFASLFPLNAKPSVMSFKL